MMHRFLCSAAIGLLTGLSSQAMEVHATYAKGDRAGIEKRGIILGWLHPQALWQNDTWQLWWRHEVEWASWSRTHPQPITEIGYSPVFRLQPRTEGQYPRGMYVEGSIGIRMLSHTHLDPTTSVSTAWQFSDMVGVGYQWGWAGQHTLGLRLQHLSNGGIKKPNPGINYTQVHYAYRF